MTLQLVEKPVVIQYYMYKSVMWILKPTVHKSSYDQYVGFFLTAQGTTKFMICGTEFDEFAVYQITNE